MSCATTSERSSSAFDTAVERLLSIEGGYANHPDDPGGATRYGITEAAARRHGYDGTMSELPLEVARVIYRDSYWAEVKGEHLAAFAPGLAFEVFEIAVNLGVAEASLWLQQLLNTLNQGGQLYADIATDGIIGPVTLGALDEYRDVRGEEGLDVLRAGLNCLQGAWYVEEAQEDSSDEAFLYGWLRQRVLNDKRA